MTNTDFQIITLQVRDDKIGEVSGEPPDSSTRGHLILSQHDRSNNRTRHGHMPPTYTTYDT